MMHKHCFEAFDRTMRDLLRFFNPRNSDMTFGGKIVVLGGDFTNTTFYSKGNQTRYSTSKYKFFLPLEELSSDGNLGSNNDDECKISIAYEFLLEIKGDCIPEIVDSTFPSYCSGKMDPKDPETQAILAPTLDVVDYVNEYMNGMNEASSKTYLSCDSVYKLYTNADMLSEVHTPKFLNNLRCSGIPNHSLSLIIEGWLSSYDFEERRSLIGSL
ncbi:PREDICTED: uncharacterized protein LOC109152127 [Ipomoea nil]|uniref:uncharacterized protein LOC109152127 n=1 Tax=Ipomoea nil TaxID=35883 RepID=UPI0009011932|nr:PREDICTED: uncharacterized protein LOC109152127 [Ipomoea nil]